MAKVLDYETAKGFKAAGLPQPKPSLGQFWYLPNNPNVGIIIADGDFLYHQSLIDADRAIMVRQYEFKNMIFAPVIEADLVEFHQHSEN